MADLDDDSDKRDRSPKFPYINLTVALERTQQVYAASRGNAVRLIDIASDWGVSPTSSSTLRIAAAMLSYGLIDDEGSGDSRRIKLTPDALRILSDARPGVREDLLATAAVKPPIIEEYFAKWGRSRPSDAHAISSLKFDRGFTERAARTFLGVYDDIVSYIPDGASLTTDKLQETPKISEHNVHLTAGPSALAVELQAKPSAQNDSTTSEHEWLRVRVSKDVTARILVNGQLNPRMIERLITVLAAQKDVMDEDF